MAIYFAQTGNRHLVGGLEECLAWATREVDRNQSRIVWVSRIRAGEKEATLVAEVASDGTRFLRTRLTTRVSAIRRILKSER